MTTLQWINAIIAAVGIPVIAGALIFIGRKLQVLDALELSVEKMKHNLKVVSDYLIRNASDFDPKELHALSPLQLTDDGKKLIRDTGFGNVFEKNQKDFFDFIDSEEPKFKYDVELSAIKSISALSDKEYMGFLKIFFFNNPNRSMENTAPTLGVYIRDAYLATHPEITQ